MTIYEQVGGNGVLKTAVSVFYGRVTEDETLAKWFEGADLSRLMAHQRAFLASALGGPHLFTGNQLGSAHAGMEITDEAFTTIVGHLLTTLADLGVDPGVLAQVEERLETQRALIVTA